MSFKRTSFAALLLSISLGAAAQNPSWIRRNSISPDGKSLAFSYMGDIYKVSTQGGEAVQLSSNPAYDSEPLWTTDGKSIVFASYREGSKDLYICSADGGSLKRLTTLPGNETPLAVLADGTVLFSAYNAALISDDYDGFPGSSQLYSCSTEGGIPRLLSSLPMGALSVNGAGAILYEDYKGYEDPLRKHHTSSVTRDIWICIPPAGEGLSISPKSSFTKLSDFKGEDRNPVFAADGDTFYYLSERDGKTSNIYRSSLSRPEVSVQLSFETRNPVRFLSVSGDGLLAYSCNGDIYTLREGESPKKLQISLKRDESERKLQKMNLSSGANSLAVSPDGKEMAIVLRGDVFVTSADYRTTRRITNTPEQ